ncbi:hypothetical protein LCGC14_2777740, partial [marine sediment metagenome]
MLVDFLSNKDYNSEEENAVKDFYDQKIQKLDFFSQKPVNAMIHRFLINKMLYKIYDTGPQLPKNLVDCVYAEDFDHKKPEWLINGTYYPFGKFFNLIKKDDQKRIKLTIILLLTTILISHFFLISLAKTEVYFSFFYNSISPARQNQADKT